MLTVNNLGLQFGKRILFDEVNVKFTQGNAYGVIGANGAGKSTFLRILSGEQSPTSGSYTLDKGKRMAVLKQDHYEFEDEVVLDTVLMGHREMYKIAKEKDAIYMDPEATEADGLRAAELENRYGEMGGWTAESDAAELLSNLGIKEELHHKLLKELSGSDKVKVLLAQTLFGDPDIMLLDEPTNDLDARTIEWLADFLIDFKNTVIIVSHDRYFLDKVCTHIADIDFSKIKVYTGNYTFWYESSQLALKQREQKNKKVEAKRKELQEFIQRFSANASKSKQATSRKKVLEKLDLEEIQPSSRKYPYIKFNPAREAGDQILKVNNLSAKGPDGKLLFSNVSFVMGREDKIAFVSEDSNAITTFFQIIAGEAEPDGGSFEWGQTITPAYVPLENGKYFSGENDLDMLDWLSQFTSETDQQFMRGFLGRMLFKGEEVNKKVSVLSGGEKMRCMFSKAMLSEPNFLIMDEPTNHLDLESITALNNGMQEFNGPMMFSSHDYELNNTVANRVIELRPDGISDRLCSYEEFLHPERKSNIDSFADFIGS